MTTTTLPYPLPDMIADLSAAIAAFQIGARDADILSEILAQDVVESVGVALAALKACDLAAAKAALLNVPADSEDVGDFDEVCNAVEDELAAWRVAGFSPDAAREAMLAGLDIDFAILWSTIEIVSWDDASPSWDSLVDAFASNLEIDETGRGYRVPKAWTNTFHVWKREPLGEALRDLLLEGACVALDAAGIDHPQGVDYSADANGWIWLPPIP